MEHITGGDSGRERAPGPYDTRGTEWGPIERPAPKRKLVDTHDVGGLILFGILVAPLVWFLLKALFT